MKTILVLTDFSKNAKIAAQIAIEVADKINAGILLFNAYPRFPFLPSEEFVAWPPEYYVAFKDESADKISKEKKRLIKLISQKQDLKAKIDIKYITSEGAVAEHLPSLIKEKDIYMIIIGGREKTAGNFLFGSEINGVLSKASCPILITGNKKALTIKNIVFATDLETNDIQNIECLLAQSKIFHYHLHICHVSQPPVFAPDFDEEDRTSVFINALSKVNYDNLSYKNLEGDHIGKELEKFSQEINGDLYVLVHKKQSIFWRILHQSPSKTLLKQQQRPILVLPEIWKK